MKIFITGMLLAVWIAAAFAQNAPGSSGRITREQVLIRGEDNTSPRTISDRIRAIENAELANQVLPLFINGELCRVGDIPRLPAGEDKDLALKALQKQIDDDWGAYVTFHFQWNVDKNVTVIDRQEAETRRLLALLDGKEDAERRMLLLTGEDFRSLRYQASRYGINPEAFIERLWAAGLGHETVVRIGFNIDTLSKFARNPKSYDVQAMINFAKKYAHLKMFDDTAVLRRIADLGIVDDQVLERIDPEFRIRGTGDKIFSGTYITTEAALEKLEEIKGELWYDQLANRRGGDGLQDISSMDISEFDNQFGKDLQRLGIANSRRLIEYMSLDGAGWSAVATTLCNLDIFRAGGVISPTERNIRNFAIALKDMSFYERKFAMEFIRENGELPPSLQDRLKL
jgi:hypothetical protein